MIRREPKSLIPFVLGCAAVVLFSAAVAMAQSADQGQRTDGQIESDVVHALDASATLKNDLITAATIQSGVTLSGTVSSQASKDLAGAIAQGVPGVTKVHNNLSVGDPRQAAEQQNMPADADQGLDQGPSPAPAQPQPGGMDQAQNQPVPQPDQNTAQSQQQPQQPQQAQPAAPQRPTYGTPNRAQNQPQYPQGQPQNSQQYPPQYPPQYPRGRQQYPAPPPGYAQQPAYRQPSGPVTISPGTLIALRTNEAVASKRAQNGAPVEFTVIQDISVGGVLAIPRGAVVHGVIAEVKQVGHGDLGGSASLALALTSLDLGGQNYPIESDMFRIKGPNKAGETVGNAIAGGLIGTIIGCAAGRGAGCAIGAGAGVAAGTAASAATNGPQAWIPAEARVDFHLAAPLTVNPVGPQEAARLAQGLYQGGPALYPRPGPVRVYGGYGYPAYAYPPVYFRPYYRVGAMYYWR